MMIYAFVTSPSVDFRLEKTNMGRRHAVQSDIRLNAGTNCSYIHFKVAAAACPTIHETVLYISANH